MRIFLLIKNGIMKSSRLSRLRNKFLKTKKMNCILKTCGAVLIVVFTCSLLMIWGTENSTRMDPRSLLGDRPSQSLRRMMYQQPSAVKPPRTDVNILTPWLAPIVWEGTFNYDIINKQFKIKNYTVGLTVFAVKKYVRFLKDFLKTAEKYFLVGHRLNYYVFTDQPEAVPVIELQPNRFLHIIRTVAYKRWQDVSIQRMKHIMDTILERFHKEVDYLVCSDSDMIFTDHVGVEIIDDLVAVVHPFYYNATRSQVPYERRKESQAYIPLDEGDFYYMAAFYAGTVQEIYKLTSACYKALKKDRKRGIEAIWHEESHFNKYLLYNKPTKLLSPEYIWDNQVPDTSILKKKRFLCLLKNYDEIRN